jgi:hypothetical protein
MRLGDIVLERPRDVRYRFNLDHPCKSAPAAIRLDPGAAHLEDCNVAAGEVIHAADNVDLPGGVTMLEDWRRS